MQRYIIIRMYRAEKMLEDWHDINLDDCKTHSAALQKWANAQGAVCFLQTPSRPYSLTHFSEFCKKKNSRPSNAVLPQRGRISDAKDRSQDL